MDEIFQLFVNWDFGMLGIGAFLLPGREPGKEAKAGLFAATADIDGPCMGAVIRSFGCCSRKIILNNCLYSQYLFFIKKELYSVL